MTDAKKQAEAVAKTAQKAYDAAAKKADDALAKYRPLRADANRKARELAYALANPELFEDDDLTPVSIALGRVAHTVSTQRVEVGPAKNYSYEPTQPQTATVDAGTAHVQPLEAQLDAEPVADPPFDNPITVAGVPAEERGTRQQEATYVPDAEALVAAGIAAAGAIIAGDPWDQPQPPPAVDPTAPAKRKRRTKAEMEAARAAEAEKKLAGIHNAAAEPSDDDSDDDSAIDGDAQVAVFADPFATQQAPPNVAQQPVAQPPAVMVPEGYVHIGFGADGQPSFAKIQQQAPPASGQQPVIKPPF